MKNLLILEEVGVFLLCIFLFSRMDFAWWWFPVLLLLPDVGMIGYLISPQVGAVTYNLVHHRLVAAAVAVIAIWIGSDNWKLAALILFAHISMDRMVGYGLKYSDSFFHTHLGWIQPKKAE
jgi:Domain of unknown function (DUF4260)